MINVVSGGSGPPLLLLHGYAQTHIEWRKMGSDLARNYTLVMTDLRGKNSTSGNSHSSAMIAAPVLPTGWRALESLEKSSKG